MFDFGSLSEVENRVERQRLRAEVDARRPERVRVDDAGAGAFLAGTGRRRRGKRRRRLGRRFRRRRPPPQVGRPGAALGDALGALVFFGRGPGNVHFHYELYRVFTEFSA